MLQDKNLIYESYVKSGNKNQRIHK